MKIKSQKLLTRTLRNTPTDSLVRSNCGPLLNREETLSVADLKTVNNNPEENLLSGRRGRNLRVFVLNMHGKPLMPTTPGKARKLLRKRLAKVIMRTPFTIQLTYATGEVKQDTKLGVDTGYKFIGLSAVSDTKELFNSEIGLRTDIPKLLSEKRQYRRIRRNRLWYRKPKFLNRGIKAGWLTPSIEHRLNEHIKAIEFVKSILPVTKITVEAAAFDIQKIKDPDISGVEYQNGEQAGFWNIREYVLYRDNHICQACNGKNKDKVLNVHHIESRQIGGNRPDNLITLCKSCHKAYHKGKIKLSIKKHKAFKAETVMSILRWKIVNKLKELGYTVSITYGYLTKSARIALKLNKSHSNDAFCIAGGSWQERTDVISGSFTRRQNRCTQLNRKSFKPSIKKIRYKMQPNDLVKCEKEVFRVIGVYSYGKYVKLKNKLNEIFNINIKKADILVYGKGLQFN